MTMWTDLAFGTGMTTLVCLGDSRHVVIGPQTSTDQSTRCLVGYAQSESEDVASCSRALVRCHGFGYTRATGRGTAGRCQDLIAQLSNAKPKSQSRSAGRTDPYHT